MFSLSRNLDYGRTEKNDLQCLQILKKSYLSTQNRHCPGSATTEFTEFFCLGFLGEVYKGKEVGVMNKNPATATRSKKQSERTRQARISANKECGASPTLSGTNHQAPIGTEKTTTKRVRRRGRGAR